MTRAVRLLLLVAGFGLVALLVWRTGPRLVVLMLARAGWSVPAVASIYAAHVGVRAAALWRSIITTPIRYLDVVRIRLSGEAVEVLTLTGPFLAEPAKGWLLKRRGLPTADAFAAVAIEYLLYTVVSSWLAAIALALLLTRDALPPALRPVAFVIFILILAFIVAFVFAAVTGVGLIVPIVRATRPLLGASRTARAVYEIGRVEDVLVAFLHAHPRRLSEVLAWEAAAHGLLMLEIWIVIAALGLPLSWTDPVIVEGGVKFTSTIFSFVPGQVGVSEGVYTLIVGAIGLPKAAGLTLALIRRMRGLLVAAVGVVVASVDMD